MNHKISEAEMRQHLDLANDQSSDQQSSPSDYNTRVLQMSSSDATNLATPHSTRESGNGKNGVVAYDIDALVSQSIIKPNGTNGNGTNGVHKVEQAAQEAGQAEVSPAMSDYTDAGNAYRLAKTYGMDLRHVDGWGWLVWDGKRWKRSDKLVMDKAEAVTIDLYREAEDLREQAEKHFKQAKTSAAAGDSKGEQVANERGEELEGQARTVRAWARTSRSTNRLSATVKRAESRSEIRAEVRDFDQHPWLFNVANGTLDLRTGALHPHAREDMLTRMSSVEYDPNATCPTWEAFLHRIMDGNVELIEFLQQAVGYSMTGRTNEQVLLFAYGTGANGKSTFLKTIMDLMGEDYAKQAHKDLLTLSKNERHLTEVADLAGMRLVATVETEKGKALAESLLKQLTGDDKIAARFMHKDQFQFDATFTIWLASNHKPAISGTDDGIWRRIRLIPFTVTIPEKERDTQLLEKLKAEWPGILAWMVRGCLAWQKRGKLEAPREVKLATAEFRAESDVLADWLAERTDVDPQAEVVAAVLYKSYADWVLEAGIPERMSQREFNRAIVERGFGKARDSHTRQVILTGLRLHRVA